MRLLLTFAIVVVLIAAAGAIWLGATVFSPYGDYPAEGTFVDIPRGTSTRGVAALLEDNGVIRNRLAFLIYARIRGGTLQAGEYHFDRPMTASAVYSRIVSGRVYTRSITIPEGLTMFEIARRLGEQGFSTEQEFLAAAHDASPIRDLAPQARNLEGFLFPAKYEFPREVRARHIVDAMLARFREVWDSLPAEGRNPYAVSPLQAVTMASLVERETGAYAERPLVAGVYYNRLRLRRALQCDPTVLYAMELAGKNDGIIHQSDLRLDSPYNTYRYPGLPPGPIANPGEASLRAALYPSQVEYLYFVSDTQGGHFFSRTLEEHAANVRKYRRLLAESQGAAGSIPPPAPAPKATAPKSPRTKATTRRQRRTAANAKRSAAQ